MCVSVQGGHLCLIGLKWGNSSRRDTTSCGGTDLLLEHKFITQEECCCPFLSLEHSSILVLPSKLVISIDGCLKVLWGVR